MTFARVAVPAATGQVFDYWIPDGLGVARGSIVRVRLAQRRHVGVVVETRATAGVERDRVQPIDDVVPLAPLPDDVVALAEFVASYYREPLGLALALAVPPLRGGTRRRPLAAPLALVLTPTGRATLTARGRRAPAVAALIARFDAAGTRLERDAIATLDAADQRRLAAWRAAGWVEEPPPLAPPRGIEMNDDQRTALEAIDAAHDRFAVTLLQGVTGSGKTDVYAAAAQRAIARGGQVLLLVPEINLTPQLTARFAAALPDVRIATLHSGLADGERLDHWSAAASGAAALVVGTRLAVFAPLPRLALVVVDEEHDASYKQQDGVRYHARDTAIVRARSRGVPIVLGSATPSLETVLHASGGRYARAVLPRRADPRAVPPAIRFVPPDDAGAIDDVSGPLLAALAERLARGEQSLVFVNRRGYAPSLKCAACAWEAGCPRCSARLVVHRRPPRLLCHHCAHAERVPRACPNCGNVDLAERGAGTQRIEATLVEALPGARIARVDRDTTRKRGAFDAMRRDVEDDALDILVGTQMLAKGHDFPRLTLVGVVGADHALYSADFRATERLAALLFQVAGRAGRAALPGEVIVQTAFARHAVYRALATGDYDALALDLLEERRIAALPPHAHLVLLGAEAIERAEVDRFLAVATREANAARAHTGAEVEVHAPVPALLARRAGLERGQLCVQAARRPELARFLDAWMPALDALPGRRVRWGVDVDPIAL
ncbi:MAG TPA: primosomal protein N' [Casimicrobiaceae bacterium]|nr:primosomal protein N' [Casimicrobiaceae bacterium]